MERMLSSILVSIYKLVPAIPLAFAFYGILLDIRNLVQPGLIFLVAWCAIWYLLTFRWKSVRLRGSTIVVSNYLKTVQVPVSDVRWIEGSSFWGWQPQTVTLSLKSPSAFGGEIVFVPKGGWLGARSFAESLRRELGLQ